MVLRRPLSVPTSGTIAKATDYGDAPTPNAVWTTPDGVEVGAWAQALDLVNDSWAAAALVTDWYIDAVTGSDTNNGTTVATPLRTGAELQRRLGPSPQWGQSVTIHVGAGGVADALTLDGATTAVNVCVAVVGTTTQLANAGTLVAVTPMDHATPRIPTLTTTAIADWTPYLGKRIRITSGANQGACTWVLEVNPDALGLNVAGTGVWYRPRNLVPVTNLYSATTPVVGDPIVIEDLPVIDCLILIIAGVYAVAGGLGWPQKQALVDSVAMNCFTRELSSDPIAARNLVFGCRLTSVDDRGKVWRNALNVRDHVSCLLWTPTVSNVRISGVYVGLCVFNTGQVLANNTGLLSCYFTVSEKSPFVDFFGYGFYENLQVFNIASAVLAALTCSQYQTRIQNFSGKGNAGFGMILANASRLSIGGTLNLIAATANVQLSGAPVTALPATFTLANLAGCSDFAWSGKTTLVAGTKVVTVPYVDWTIQTVAVQRINPGGVIGNLSAPDGAARTTTSFTINSDNVGDTSVVEWQISPMNRGIYGTPL